ncbi:hypothetical protein ACLOJK_028023 [Asimina triloba]
MACKSSMPLEDFFTLTEMKDGLATLARVEELVGIMRTTEYDMKNLGDAARQWSTVASVLAATDSNDCLDHFIHLGGLRFLNQWLQVPQNCGGDVCNSSMDEFISVLLGALQKLPVGGGQSFLSQIGASLKHLFGHKSSKIQEEARALFDSWKQMGDEGMDVDNIQKGEDCDNTRLSSDAKLTSDGKCSKLLVVDELPSTNDDGKPADNELQHSNGNRISDSSLAEPSKEVKTTTLNQEVPSTPWNHSDANHFQGEKKPAVCSPEPRTCSERLPQAELPSLFPPEGVSCNGASNSSLLEDQNDKKSANVSEFEHNADAKKEAETGVKLEESSPFWKKDTSAVPKAGLDEPLSAQDRMKEPDQSAELDNKVSKFSPVKPTQADKDCGLLDSQPNSGVAESVIPKYLRNKVDFNSAGHAHDCTMEAMPDLYGTGIPRKSEVLKSNFDKKDPSGVTVDIKDISHRSKMKMSKAVDSILTTNSLKRIMNTRDSNEANGRMSSMELDYGEDDALEVARLVAREVEREVVDYREPFCSSSTEKDLDGRTSQPGSPVSIEGKPNEQIMVQLHEYEVAGNENSLGTSSSPKVKRLRVSKTSDSGPEPKYDVDSPQSAVAAALPPPPPPPAASESGSHVDKSRCDFDLNADVQLDEMEGLSVPIPTSANTLSAPVAVVAASKGAPSLPTVPLHFGGELGWRGSAATSAFRPASPRKTPDAEKISLVDSNSKNSRPKQNFLEFDLNVAEGDSDDVFDAVPAKPVPISSGLPSGDSSMEVSSRRAERFKLDLNCVGDNDDATTFPLPDWRMDGHFRHQQNGNNYSPSPASSSSSRHPLIRDFDLNDNPLFFETRSSVTHQHDLHKSLLQDKKACESLKVDDPVVSIMGSRMVLNRKESADQTRLFLTHFQGNESSNSIASNLTRVDGCGGAQPAMAYAPMSSHGFAYNSLAVGPASMSLSPQLYGSPTPLPYMVDSRGAMVVPQVFGQSAAAFPFSKQPILMNLTGSQSGSSGFGVLQPGLDLNSGHGSADGVARDVSTRQLFGHGVMQPAGTGMPLKRKEPECGWELNMFSSYKQETPWH